MKSGVIVERVTVSGLDFHPETVHIYIDGETN